MIQIDMPMPKNCLDCPACNEYLTCAIPINGRGWGENDVREYGNGRPDWCPMKEQEVAEGHRIVLEHCAKDTKDVVDEVIENLCHFSDDEPGVCCCAMKYQR